MASEDDPRAAGKLEFTEIPRLPDDWWDATPQSDPAIVWTVWDRHTYYLWGANAGNYEQGPIGSIIGGGGMAGPHGPSRGRNHPHYIGVITMDESTMALNDPVFAGLSDLIAGGNNVVVPIFKDTDVSATGYKLSLGTGIGATQPNWGAIQKYILVHLVALGAAAAAVDIADGTYWPDLRTQPPKLYPVASLADLENIVDTVLS